MDPEIDRLKKKVENYPSPSAYNRLAELLRQNNDHDTVVQVCRRSIREFKRKSKAYVSLAESYLDNGQRNEAIELLQNALEQDPRSSEALIVLANIHEAKGTPQEAVAFLQKALELNPDNGEIQARIDKLNSAVAASPAPAQQQETYRRETGTIDMSDMSVAMTTSSSGVSFDVAGPRTSAPVGAAAPQAAAAPAPSAAASPAPVANPLSALLNEPGVKGVVISDDQGRVVSSENMGDNQDSYFAALAHEMSQSCEEALGHLQHAPLANWSVNTEQGLLLAFRRNPALTLLVNAESTCKVAMIELRARQALIDLGGA